MYILMYKCNVTNGDAFIKYQTLCLFAMARPLLFRPSAKPY